MQSINHDPHLLLQFSEREIPEPDASVIGFPVVDSGNLRARWAQLSGHGFTRVDRLPGNVGLLEMSKFFAPGVAGAGEAAAAAMHLIAGADALLIDLRHNTGGEPEMTALVSGFLFDERTHLVDLVFPAEDRIDQYWTAPHVPAPIYGGTKPIWVLISSETFSAAEGISYQLQQSGRAVLVGEPTGGGPVTFHYPYRVSAHLLSAVPSGYPRDPVSGTNWEGTGVVPDIMVSSEDAFAVAYRAALEHVLDLGDDGDRQRVVGDARAALTALEKQPL